MQHHLRVNILFAIAVWRCAGASQLDGESSEWSAAQWRVEKYYRMEKCAGVGVDAIHDGALFNTSLNAKSEVGEDIFYETSPLYYADMCIVFYSEVMYTFSMAELSSRGALTRRECCASDVQVISHSSTTTTSTLGHVSRYSMPHAREMTNERTERVRSFAARSRRQTRPAHHRHHHH